MVVRVVGMVKAGLWWWWMLFVILFTSTLSVDRLACSSSRSEIDLF